jgi:hypothetical protein
MTPSTPGTPMGVATPGGGGYGFPMPPQHAAMSPAFSVYIPGGHAGGGFESPAQTPTDAPSPAMGAVNARKRSSVGGKRTPQDAASPLSPEGSKPKKQRSTAGAQAGAAAPAAKKKATTKSKKASSPTSPED